MTIYPSGVLAEDLRRTAKAIAMVNDTRYLCTNFYMCGSCLRTLSDAIALTLIVNDVPITNPYLLPEATW